MFRPPAPVAQPLALSKTPESAREIADGTATPLLMDDTRSLQGLTVLISEEFLEAKQQLLLNLQNMYGLECIDCPLEGPISIVVDVSTGICVVSAEMFDDKDVVRGWMLLLTKIVFKYDCICVLIVDDCEFCSRLEAFSTLRQSLLEFPCALCLRFYSEENLACNIFSICIECALSATMKDDMLISEYVKNSKILNLVTDRLVSCRSEFLQLMPTINLNLAVLMLSRWPLRKLMTFRSEKDIDIVCKELKLKSIKSKLISFFDLAHCYSGSVLSNRL